jgi:hypothetical protein
MQDYVYNKSKLKQQKFVSTVTDFWKQGKGLYIFEENDTIDDSLANQVL